MSELRNIDHDHLYRRQNDDAFVVYCVCSFYLFQLRPRVNDVQTLLITL